MIKGLLVGAGTAILFVVIRYLLWKNEVPNWISKFRWVIGIVLGIIACYIFYLLGGDTKSGTLVIAAVCLGIGYSYKNETPKKLNEYINKENEDPNKE